MARLNRSALLLQPALSSNDTCARNQFCPSCLCKIGLPQVTLCAVKILPLNESMCLPMLITIGVTVCTLPSRLFFKPKILQPTWQRWLHCVTDSLGLYCLFCRLWVALLLFVCGGHYFVSLSSFRGNVFGLILTLWHS